MACTEKPHQMCGEFVLLEREHKKKSIKKIDICLHLGQKVMIMRMWVRYEVFAPIVTLTFSFYTLRALFAVDFVVSLLVIGTISVTKRGTGSETG